MISVASVDCQVYGLDVIITVTLGTAHAVARAGPFRPTPNPDVVGSAVGRARSPTS